MSQTLKEYLDFYRLKGGASTPSAMSCELSPPLTDAIDICISLAQE